MSAATPTPQDAGLPPPPPQSNTHATFASTNLSSASIPATDPSPSQLDSTTPFASKTTATDSTTTTDLTEFSSKPTVLHLGDDIRWNHELYVELGKQFNILRSHSMGREEFKKALQEKKWGDFVAMYRPFWNTGGEMGNWDLELMFVVHLLH
jgi:hypothetical protein